mgnify:CR=1 FL=1
MSAEAAGLDLFACLGAGATLELPPGGRVLVPIGLQLQLPPGTEGQVRPRSGLALRHGITVLNSPGTIDSDYRGEVSVILINHGKKPFTINRGERIAQMIVAPIIRVALVEVAVLSGTKRGAGGFGSTGSATSASSAQKKKQKPVAKTRNNQKSKSQLKKSARSR